jgi:hypothetical protein
MRTGVFLVLPKGRLRGYIEELIITVPHFGG